MISKISVQKECLLMNVYYACWTYSYYTFSSEANEKLRKRNSSKSFEIKYYIPYSI